jgi:translation initiation factor 1
MTDDTKRDPPFHNPFASLGERKACLPPGPAPRAAPAPRGPARAVVRYERKGHGGKEMTRVEQLGLGTKELERWLQEAKQALGTGGVIDKQTLLIQGDQRERLRGWLEKKGVGKITVS